MSRVAICCYSCGKPTGVPVQSVAHCWLLEAIPSEYGVSFDLVDNDILIRHKDCEAFPRHPSRLAALRFEQEKKLGEEFIVTKHDEFVFIDGNDKCLGTWAVWRTASVFYWWCVGLSKNEPIALGNTRWEEIQNALEAS